jgi:hypothetical protein
MALASSCAYNSLSIPSSPVESRLHQSPLTPPELTFASEQSIAEQGAA